MTDTAQADRDGRLVDAFVHRHYGLAGTLRLHRRALGGDLLRAPANVALAPVFLAVRLFALALHGLGAHGAARALSRPRLQFRSDVSRTLEAALLAEVLTPRGTGGPAPEARVRLLVEAHLGVRTAVSEITATLLVLLLGSVLFHVVTPGILSLTPLLSDRAAQALALSDFPLGERLGALWYGVFPVDTPAWVLLATGTALLVGLSLLTTFAGILSDPVQRATGLHRRRLRRLLARIDAGAGEAPALEGEYLLARLADLADACATAIRTLRP